MQKNLMYEWFFIHCNVILLLRELNVKISSTGVKLKHFT